jgi:hypothetical protein
MKKEDASILYVEIYDDKHEDDDVEIYSEYNYGHIKTNRWIRKNINLFKYILKRGDVVENVNCGYRNNGVGIYDGYKCYLSSFPDDYGTVPVEFNVIFEFPILYWSERIEHNEYVPLKLLGRYLDQSVKNIKKIDKNFITFFEYNEKKYWILGNEFDDLSPNEGIKKLTETNFIRKLGLEYYRYAYEFFWENNEFSKMLDFLKEKSIDSANLLLADSYW